MHVLLIHQAFASRGEPGSTRHFEFAQHLVQRGHRVTVVTSPISYLTGRPSAANGSVRELSVDGVRLVRVWSYPAIHRSFLHRAWGFVTFMILSFLVGLRLPDVDLVWGTTPPIPQALSARVLAWIRRRPFVLEVRDLWPDFAIQAGVLRGRVLISLARSLERFLYRHAERLIVNSPGFIPHISQNGVPGETVELVPNCVSVAQFHPDARGEAVRTALGLHGKFVVLYAGAHGLANDLDTLLDAAVLLRDIPEITFLLVGDGKERPRLQQRSATLGLTNVRFAGAQPKECMPDWLAAADVGIALLRPLPLFATTYPNKVFDYMAAGRPTVLGIDGVIRDVIATARAGLWISPGDAPGLAEGILRYYQDPALRDEHGRNAHRYVAAHFDRAVQADRLERILYTVYESARRHVSAS